MNKVVTKHNRVEFPSQHGMKNSVDNQSDDVIGDDKRRSIMKMEKLKRKEFCHSAIAESCASETSKCEAQREGTGGLNLGVHGFDDRAQLESTTLTKNTSTPNEKILLPHHKHLWSSVVVPEVW